MSNQGPTPFWQSAQYLELKKSAVFCSNSFILRPEKPVARGCPFAILGGDVRSMPAGELSNKVNLFISQIVRRQSGPAPGPSSQLGDPLVKRAWYDATQKNIIVTCKSLHQKRTLKRQINQCPFLKTSPATCPPSPHHLVAREYLPDPSHKLYFRAVKLIRKHFGNMINKGQLASVWINPVQFYMNGRAILAPRVVLTWFDGAPFNWPTWSKIKCSLMLHPGVRRYPESVGRRSGALGESVQFEANLALFPRIFNSSHWDNLFLGSIRRALANADFLLATTPSPVPPTLLGPYLQPGALRQPGSCLTNGVANKPNPPTSPPPHNTAVPARDESSITGARNTSYPIPSSDPQPPSPPTKDDSPTRNHHTSFSCPANLSTPSQLDTPSTDVDLSPALSPSSWPELSSNGSTPPPPLRSPPPSTPRAETRSTPTNSLVPNRPNSSSPAVPRRQLTILDFLPAGSTAASKIAPPRYCTRLSTRNGVIS